MMHMISSERSEANFDGSATVKEGKAINKVKTSSCRCKQGTPLRWEFPWLQTQQVIGHHHPIGIFADSAV
jgi:hypothetical protein